jgi:hypothetical protein
VARLDIDGDLGASNLRRSVSASTDTDDLGLDASTTFLPRVALDWSPIHVAVTGMAISYSGDGKATGRLALGDYVIEQGTAVETDVSLDMATATIVIDPFPIPAVDLGVGLGVGALWYDVLIESKRTVAEIDREGSLPMGFLTARAAADLGPVSLLGTLSGIALELESDDVSYIDLDLSAGYRLFGDDGLVEGRAYLGYRYMGVDYTWTGGRGRFEAELALHGPYLGFELSF